MVGQPYMVGGRTYVPRSNNRYLLPHDLLLLLILLVFTMIDGPPDIGHLVSISGHKKSQPPAAGSLCRGRLTHVFDHSAREFAGLHLGRALHLPLEVVGYVLLLDRLLHG